MRIILLLSPASYRATPFLEAARRLGVEVVKAVDVPPGMPGFAPGALPLDFHDPAGAARAIADYAAQHAVDAVVPVDDGGTLIAARASDALGLPFNAPAAAEAARDKARMRALLETAGVPSPQFRVATLNDDPEDLAERTRYPAVLKPCRLSASRGVMRADDPLDFIRAFERLRGILSCGDDARVLIEDFIPGVEVALEGLLQRGQLRVLALFDKPDPLDGPFFEETLYVTPSRLPAETQAAIADCAQRACAALGLQTGPVHAELRVNERGAWIVEVAGRSIGGLCSRTLRFGTPITLITARGQAARGQADASLEELILRQALGLDTDDLHGAARAGGVMMIPIPGAGRLVAVEGQDEARAVPGIESIEITAAPGGTIRPLPEGDSYLGFIFARGAEPAEVEAALRAAHACLRVRIEPELTLEVRRGMAG
jgi:biotin carboxylase